MPVLKGTGRKVVSQNIRELEKGKTHARTEAKEGKKAADKQSIAIALETERKSGGGRKPVRNEGTRAKKPLRGK